MKHPLMPSKPISLTVDHLVSDPRRLLMMGAAAALAQGLIACGGGGGGGVAAVAAPLNSVSPVPDSGPRTVPGAVPGAPATYRVTLRSAWTAAAFGTQFPSGAHFSGLVGATHHAGVAFWTEGRAAALGIQNVAELGSKEAFINEVNLAIAAGMASAVLSGPGISGTQTEAMLSFTVSPSHPLLTLVSMVAPSPDWFAGVGGLALYQDGLWKDLLTVPLEVYDTGTDSGRTFTSANQVTSPAGMLLPLSSAEGETDFAKGVHRSTGAYIALMVFERTG